MPRLFWIGSPFFHRALEQCGWEVVHHNFEEILTFDWQNIVKLADGEPDVVVVADKSRPPFVLGQESFPCTTVFYAVDTHIHSWLPLYAQGFDLCLVSLKDHLQRFQYRLPKERIVWSPPFALSHVRPQLMLHQWPCLFVGRVNSATSPKRSRFLESLGQRLPELHVTSGHYPELYAQADVVLNISERGDLNFRVFEALACGACLVTPKVGHGLEDLFQNDRDCVFYPELDVEAALQAIQRLLREPQHRQCLAEAGLAAVDAGHRDIHRAQALTQALQELPTAEIVARQTQAPHIRKTWLRPLYLHFAESLSHTLLREKYLQAATGKKNSAI